MILQYLSFALACLAWGGSAVLLSELTRDTYHFLSHIYPPLIRLHTWHHKAFRNDLSQLSPELYRKSQFFHDAPESIVMFCVCLGYTGFAYLLTRQWSPLGASIGCAYALHNFSIAFLRGFGFAQDTDPNHQPGAFDAYPSVLTVNRSYHWRHHAENPNAYFCGVWTFVDKVLGTAMSLKGKTVAITGASGAMGLALAQALMQEGATVIGITSTASSIEVEMEGQTIPIQTIPWQIGSEEQLLPTLKQADILILNHGINVHSDRSAEAITQSLEVNAMSHLRLLELFYTTVQTNLEIASKEVWLNTSEAEVAAAYAPTYEIIKRMMGNLVTLRRLDAPCVVRKLILGGFKSQLNPQGEMSPEFVAKMVIAQAKRDFRTIIVSYRLWVWIVHPFKEFFRSRYYRVYSQASKAIPLQFRQPLATPVSPD